MGERKTGKVVLRDSVRTDLGGIDRSDRDCIYLKNVFQQELLGYLVICGMYFERDGYHVGAFVERLQGYIDEF